MGSAKNSLFLIQKAQLDNGQTQGALFQLDLQGEKISGRKVLLQKTGRLQRQDKMSLLQFFEKAANGSPEKSQHLLIRQAGEEPLDCLRYQNYLQWQTVFSRVQIDDQWDTTIR